MYDELIKPILQKLDGQEEAAIDNKAREAAEAEQRQEHEYSDEGRLQRLALDAGELLISTYQRQQQAGILTRHLHRSQPKVTLTFDIVKPAFPAGMASTATVFRTLRSPLLIAETVYQDTKAFRIGWKIGVKMQQRASMDSFNRFYYFKYPLSIGQFAVEEASGEANGHTVYEVDMHSGGLVSYTDGQRADELLTKYGSAASHAAWIIGHAVQLLGK